jgi:tryptophan halogenase
MKKIIIYGNGLAAYLTASSLCHQLPSSFELVLLTPSKPSLSDSFYGNVTTPDAYQFNLNNGLSEPEVLLSTNTAFNFGTRFQKWAGTELSWTQCFHLAMPVESGVNLHQFVAREGHTDIGRYLISAKAANKGVFAHPPTDDHSSPLSRAEYGYQFCSRSFTKLLAHKLSKSSVKVVKGDVKDVQVVDDKQTQRIEAIVLQNGDRLCAELFIDCNGPDSQLFSKLSAAQSEDSLTSSALIVERKVSALSCDFATAQLGPPCRHVRSFKLGWISDTPVKDAVKRVLVCDPQDVEAAKQELSAQLVNAGLTAADATNKISTQEFTLGRRSQAWIGNCVAVGHAAYVVEPLTPAPMMLLQKDIERLLELIPVGRNMQVESKEFNRRFVNDYEHATLFHHAMFTLNTKHFDGAYWHKACDALGSDSEYCQDTTQLRKKLDRKLSQFLHRGVLASFDHEPFNEEDWTILHCGMQRLPKNYDRMANQIPKEQMAKQLQNVDAMLDKFVAKMPPHALYMSKFLQYLQQQYK